MKTAVIIELPDKGAFAPNKIGTSHGNFLKTNIPNQKNPSWIWEGKLYSTTDEKDISEFNTVCAKILPHAHRRRLRCVVRLVAIPAKKRATKAPKAKIEKASEKRKAPSLPPLSTPPTGG